MSQKRHLYKGIVLYSSLLLSLSLTSLTHRVSANDLEASSTTSTVTVMNDQKEALSDAKVNETTKQTHISDSLENTANSTISEVGFPTTDNKDTKTQYDELLQDWNSIIAGNDVYDKDNAYMASFNQKLEETVDKHIATFNTTADRKYLWEDKGDYSVSANMTATYRKLEDIAKQINNPSSKYFEQLDAITLVRDGLEFLYQNVYNENTRYRQQKGNASVNWWDFEIGTPRAINNTLSLMKSHFSHDEIMKYTQPIEALVPDPTIFRATSTNPDFPTFKAAVANMTDMGRVKLIAGLLRQDDKTIEETIKAIETAFTFVTEGNGFYQDGSLIDHAVTNPKSPLYNKGVAYNGSYGNVLIDGLSQLIPIIQKTKSPMSMDKMNVIYHWIDEAFLPLIVHGELMDMSRGRSISRVVAESHVAAVEVLRAILRVAEMSPEPYQTTLKTKVKAIVTEGNAYYDVFKNLKTHRDIQLMKNLLEEETIPLAKAQNSIKLYHSMDKLAAYNANKGYGIGLSLFSSNTQNFEAMNNENLRGWHTSDGMFYLYNGDLGHYSDNYWPTVNPYRLPGTTETDVKRIDGTAKNIKDNPDLVGMGILPSGSFVGSEKVDETTALAAMAFTNFNQTLTLNKGWFILDGKIIFVANNIQNTSSDKVFTTIDQRKEDPEHPFTTYVNNQKVSLPQKLGEFPATRHIFLETDEINRNIGYIFFTPTDVDLAKAVQTGKSSDIKGDEKSAKGITEVSNTFITISQEHQLNGDTYAYIIVPNISREGFNQLVSNLDVTLVQNDSQAMKLYDANNDRFLTIHFDDKQFQVEQKTQDSDPTPNSQAAESQEKESPLVRMKHLANNSDDKSPLKNRKLPKTGQSRHHLGLIGLGLIGLVNLLNKPYINKKEG